MLFLIQLYLTDYAGAFVTSGIFAVTSLSFTVVSLFFPNLYYGFGFLLAALVFATAAVIRLNYFLKRLPYYILSVQPLVSEDRSGIFTRLGEFLEDTLEGHKK